MRIDTLGSASIPSTISGPHGTPTLSDQQLEIGCWNDGMMWCSKRGRKTSAPQVNISVAVGKELLADGFCESSSGHCVY